MRELEAAPVAPRAFYDPTPCGYVREVFLEDRTCWGLFNSDGVAIFVGDDARDCHVYAVAEHIRIQIIH
jgi:hypothetical protein